MTYEAILENICEIVAEVVNVSVKTIDPSMKLTGDIGNNDLHMDSLEFVKIIIAIEDRFEITVDFEEYFETVSDFAVYVLKEVSDKK